MFTVTLTLPSNANATLRDAVATGTIEDNDEPPVLSIADKSELENVGTMTFRVQLNVPSSREVTVRYTTLDGTAILTDDYETAVGLLKFSPGDTEKEIEVTIIEDELDEEDEDFTVRLNLPTNATLSGDGETLLATGTIKDNDDPPSLSITDASIEEADVSMVFIVELSAASAKTVMVNYATSNGTATAGEDYTAKSGMLTFEPDGSLIQTISVSIIEDLLDEADAETFTVTLSMVSNATISDATATGTITDDDELPVLSIGTDQTLTEVGTDMIFTVTLDAASSKTITIDFATANVTATAGKDYTARSGTLTFSPDGGLTQTITVPIFEDETDEEDETFTVTLSNASNATIDADATSATGTITDDEATPMVTLILTPDEIGEDGEVSTVTATLSGASSEATTVTVSVAAVSPAVAGDFTQSGTTLRIAAGQTMSTGTVTIRARNNDRDAPDKTVTVSGSASGGRGVSDPTSLTLTITDDEATPTVTLTLTPDEIGEDGEVSTVTATLSGKSSEDVTVTVSATAVSPAVPGDFTQSGTTLTISAGTTSSTGTVTITAVNNNTDAPNKTITVSASVSGGHSVAAPTSQTLTITDDEGAPTVSLVLSPASINENGVSRITATLNRPSSEAVTVTVSAVAVSPAVAGDFNLSTNKTLTITAGRTTSTGTVTIRAVNNNVDAPNKEITVSGSASGGGGAASPAQKRLTITDDEDTPTVTLTLTPSSIGESGGVSTVTASMNILSSEGVAVTVSVPASMDITQSGTTLTITEGTTSSTGSVTITAVNNNVDTPNKTVTVSGSASGGLGVANPTDKTLTITDDDTRGVTVSTDNLTVTEGGSANYTVKLDTEPTGDVVIEVNVPSGSEVSVDDETLRFTTGNWNNPQTMTVRAEADEDAVVDAPVTLTHTVSGNDYRGCLPMQ